MAISRADCRGGAGRVAKSQSSRADAATSERCRSTRLPAPSPSPSPLARRPAPTRPADPPLAAPSRRPQRSPAIPPSHRLPHPRWWLTLLGAPYLGRRWPTLRRVFCASAALAAQMLAWKSSLRAFRTDPACVTSPSSTSRQQLVHPSPPPSPSSSQISAPQAPA